MFPIRRIAKRRFGWAKPPIVIVALLGVNACGDAGRHASPTAPAAAATSGRPTLGSSDQILRASSINGGAPIAVESDQVLSGLCAFDIRLQSSGKAKMLVVGNATSMMLFTSPALEATLTNLSSQRQVTLAITGAFHVTTDSDGNSVYVVTGRNLLADPLAGFVLAEGVFSFTLDASGNLVKPLSGKGQKTNICTLLS